MTDLSLKDLSKIFSSAASKSHSVTSSIAKATGAAIMETAKSKIGTYQPASGQFPAWAQLEDSTKTQRENAGYTPNDPLLRSGELRDSITMRSSGNAAIIGTDKDTGLWMENGTETIPPRPYLGPAAEDETQNIGKIAAPFIKTAFSK